MCHLLYLLCFHPWGIVFSSVLWKGSSRVLKLTGPHPNKEDLKFFFFNVDQFLLFEA